jgi:hypothetical protein
MSDLKSFFDFAAEQAAVIFRERGEFAPMWHAVADDGEHMLICTPWEDNESKRAIVERLRELFRARGVTRYAFMCEAWAIMAPNLESVEGAYRKHHSLKDHPDRREILTVHAEDRDGHTVAGWFYILRPEHAPATLSPLRMSEATEHQGALHGLLREKT